MIKFSKHEKMQMQKKNNSEEIFKQRKHFKKY